MMSNVHRHLTHQKRINYICRQISTMVSSENSREDPSYRGLSDMAPSPFDPQSWHRKSKPLIV